LRGKTIWRRARVTLDDGIGKAAASPRCNVIVCVTIFSHRPARMQKLGMALSVFVPSEQLVSVRAVVDMRVSVVFARALSRHRPRLHPFNRIARLVRHNRRLKHLPIFRITSITTPRFDHVTSISTRRRSTSARVCIKFSRRLY